MSIRRVRPSSLAIAAYCKRAPVLAAIHNESRDPTRLGSEVDRQVTAMIHEAMAGGAPVLPDGAEPLPEADRCLEWLQATYPIGEWEWIPQRKVTLVDPMAGETLTAGTLDLVCLHRVEPWIAVVDWKKKGQMWTGNLPPPRENPQLLSYLAGIWTELAPTRPILLGDVVLAFWDERGVEPKKGDPLTEQDLWQIIDEVRAIPPFDLDEPLPEAGVGGHCDHCWQRMHCDAHLLPAAAVLQAGLTVPEFGGAGGQLTEDGALKALVWLEQADGVLVAAKKLRDLVRENVNAYTDQHGPVVVGELEYGPVPTKGSRSGATVATLKAAGLEHLIRPASPGITHKWKPARTRGGPAQE